MPLPEGFPLTPMCNCALDAASIGLLILAPALSFALGYLVCFMRGKDKP
jgi:hypothetical protein